ncbi:MAG: hypothetical protein AB1814_15915 [Thermodesulfobacteriota bacterium]
MKRLLPCILLAVSFCAWLPLVSAPAAADQVKYYKYALSDLNWFYVFKGELPGPQANQATYYLVTLNSQGQYVRVQRFVRGKAPSYATYVYDAQGRRVQAVEYNSGDNKVKGQTSYAYQGRLLKEMLARDAQGHESQRYVFQHHQDGTHEAEHYLKGQKTGARWVWFVNLDGLVERYRWHVSPQKYYERDYDPDTGFTVNSQSYVDDKLNFSQKFIYDQTGIMSGLIAYDIRGRVLSESQYRDGLRIRALYKRTSGKFEVYKVHEWEYNPDRNVRRFSYKLEGRLAYAIVYERDSKGTVLRSTVLDGKGQPVAEYYGYLEYLNRDATPADRTQLKGKVFRKVQLW